MNAKGIIIGILSSLIFLSTSQLFAQKASAEKISSFLPADMDSGEEIKEGIQNIFHRDNRLYVINIWSGLQILDISNIKEPKELGAFTPEYRAFNVYVDDKYAYLSQKSGGVLILDVQDPAHITPVKQLKTKGDAYYVLANFPYLYVAEEAKGVAIYDISDVTNPIERGRFTDAKSWNWSMFRQDSLLYVGAKKGGLVILEVSDPGSPKKLGVLNSVKFTKSVQVVDGVAYVAEGPDGFVIADVRNPRRPKLISEYRTKGWTNHVFKSGNTVFVSNDKLRQLEIVDVTDITNPLPGGVFKSDSKIYAAVKSNVYVYVAADNKSLILRYNRPPVIEAIAAQQVDENQLLQILPKASDPDKDAIFFRVENLPKNAVFDSTTGSITWTPDFEQSGIYKNVTIHVVEITESALQASTTFDITVNHVNRLPELPEVVASTVAENEPLKFTIAEGSDADREDIGKLTYSVDPLPEGARFNAQTRTFSWIPTYEQSGVYPLTFTVTDGMGGKASQPTSITVTHVDRKPVLAEVGQLQVDENKLLTFKLEGSDPDKEDQDAQSYRAENLPEGAVFDATQATFSWTPTYDQSGTYERLIFIYTAGAMSDSIRVDVDVAHVNRAPVLAAVADQSVDENQVLSFTVSGSDPDVEDAGKLVYSAQNLPQGAEFNADSARFTWKPTFEQSGIYPEVLFKISDPSGLSDSKTLTISVIHVNRSPLLAAIEPKVVDENSALTFELEGSDPDVEDAGKLVYTIDNLPQNAVLEGNRFSWTPTFDQSGTYPMTFTVSDGQLSDSKATQVTVNHVNRPPVLDAIAAQTVDENANLSFTVTGSDPDVEDAGKLRITAEGLPQGAVFDTSTATFTWLPGFEQSGSYTVLVNISDPAGLKQSKEVPVTVVHVNRTPEFPAQAAQTVDENQALNYQVLAATDPDREDAGKLVYSATDLPEGAQFDGQSLLFSWTPTYEQSGDYTVKLSVTDGEFTVEQPLQITVNHVNRAPQLEAIAAQTVDENSAWTLVAKASDPDREDQGQLTLTAENLPAGAVFDAASTTFSWTPTYEQSGEYAGIVVRVADPAGLENTQTFTITVNHVNRAPELQAAQAVTAAENEPIAFTLQATDADKEDQGKLVFSCSNLPEGATLDAASGGFAWTPNFLQAGSYTLNFKVADSGNLTSEQAVTLEITDSNRPPAFEEIPSVSAKENEAFTVTVTARDEDSDNKLTYRAENLPEGAGFDSKNGTISWTPTYEQAGTYTPTITVSDGKAEASASVSIEVQNVNRAPSVSGPGSAETEAGGTIDADFDGSDPDGDELSFEASGLPSGAEFDAASGTLHWVTGEDQAGSWTVKITVSDGEQQSDTSISLTVRPKPVPVAPDSSNN